MIRVLQVVNNMHRAGLETLLMNYYRNMDREKIQFDFLTHRPEEGDYDAEIREMGGKVYYAPRLYPKNYVAYFRWMKRFFLEHPEYQIMHSHIDAMSYLPLLAAKMNGIPVRIAHSHSTSIDKDYKYCLKQIFRWRINTVANVRIACGQEAGIFLFRKQPFQVIPNAVDASLFYYDEEVRAEKRQELGLHDEFVVGHVGRFYYPKNHKFLLNIFRELLKQRPDAKLMLVGTGEKFQETQNYAKELEIEESVMFMGNRSDVASLYQVMDVFILPSLFEGVPLVGIEAQFSDLPCIFSDRVPKEVSFTDRTEYISLEAGTDVWAGKILDCCNSPRESRKDTFTHSKYDIKNVYEQLDQLYTGLSRKIGEDENGKKITVLH